MKLTVLTNETFLLFAAQHYDHRGRVTLKDFHDDVNRVRYIKRLLTRYQTTGVLRDRLIVNHLICLWNMFGKAMLSMLFSRIDAVYWPTLKTFLVFLNIFPTGVQITEAIEESSIPLDTKAIEILRRV